MLGGATLFLVWPSRLYFWSSNSPSSFVPQGPYFLEHSSLSSIGVSSEWSPMNIPTQVASTSSSLILWPCLFPSWLVLLTYLLSVFPTGLGAPRGRTFIADSWEPRTWATLWVVWRSKWMTDRQTVTKPGFAVSEVCVLGQVTAFPILSFCICKMGITISSSQNCEGNYIRAPARCLKFTWNPINTGLSW